MDIITYIFSFNQVSFFAFLIIFAFLAYETFMFFKERSVKSKPRVPKFNQQGTMTGPVAVSINEPELTEPVLQEPTITANVVENPLPNPTSTPLPARLKHNYKLIAICGLATVFIVTIVAGAAIYFKNASTKKDVKVTFEEIKSTGIKVFSSNWKELGLTELRSLKTGDTIVVAIETIRNDDIDKARIKVNTPTWSSSHELMTFKTEYNVYYKEYKIPQGFVQLKIDAQLHSISRGWLTD